MCTKFHRNQPPSGTNPYCILRFPSEEIFIYKIFVLQHMNVMHRIFRNLMGFWKKENPENNSEQNFPGGRF